MSNHQSGRTVALRASTAILGMLLASPIAYGQNNSTFRTPSLEGPSGNTLKTTSGVGLGGAASAATFGSLGQSRVATVRGSGLGNGNNSEGGYYATNSPASPAGPAPRFSTGSLLSPVNGLSSFGIGSTGRRAPAGQPLPLAIGTLQGQSAAVPSYMPFSGSDVPNLGPLAVPHAQTDLDADLPESERGQFELSEVFQQQIGLRYARLVERAWTQFRGGDYQAALHAFRSVEDLSRDLMARDSGAARAVNHGMMLAYMADKAYSAAGQQMLVLLRSDPRLFDLSRRAILQNYATTDEFRQQLLALREHIASGGAEPGMKLALCYCVWLGGNGREALDMARSFARQVPPSESQPYFEFVRRAEARRNTAS